MKKISNNERIEKMISPIKKALEEFNVSSERFIELLKKYSRDSPGTYVITRKDIWDLTSYMIKNSKCKFKISEREFIRMNEKQKDLIYTYFALKDNELMRYIAKLEFSCVHFVEQLHDKKKLCLEWNALIDKVQIPKLNQNFQKIVSDQCLPVSSAIFDINDDQSNEDDQFPNEYELFEFIDI